MHKILIVEDEKKQLDILIDYFESENFEVLSAKDGISAVQRAVSEKPDIIILDLMLPEKNGFDVCREIRKKGISSPIIMLTAKSEEVDKIMGLELGADDYVTKPFSLRELHARVKARFRRIINESQKDEFKLSNGKTINFKTSQVEGDGKIKELSRMETDILRYFINNPNIVLSRYDTLKNVWGQNYFPESRILDAHIVNLRKKIEKDYKNPQILLTVHGRGYKFMG